MGIRPSGTVRTMVRLRGSAAPVSLMPKSRLVVVLVVLAATLTFGAGSAAAKAPCWKTLLNDWYDGRIDGTYPVHCYTQAINHLPEDLQDYSQARSDLSRALDNAILAMTDKGSGPPGPNTPVPPGGKRSTQSHKDKGFFNRLASALGPGNATSIPLPLLILAGVGLLLIAAAGASIAARKIQARRSQPQPATVPPAPPNRRK
jgi:hypothetical protein